MKAGGKVTLFFVVGGNWKRAHVSTFHDLVLLLKKIVLTLIRSLGLAF